MGVLPFRISLKIKDVDVLNFRKGIDVLILLDVSSSMEGEKLTQAI